MTGVEPEDHLRVGLMANHLLDCIGRTFEEAGETLPSRQQITVGSVAVEEALVAVMYGQLSVGLPGNDMSSPQSYDRPRTATFNIELWRSTPGRESPKAPSARKISERAEITMNDSWLLMEAAYLADRENHGRGIVATITVLPPQGSMQGLSLSLEMQVP